MCEIARTVLLHPIGLDRESWQFLDLDDAVAIDLPGHGQAKHIPGISLSAVAEHVCAVVDGPFHVVGLSLGGIIAQHLALHHADQVLSAVVACASGATDPQVLCQRAADVEQRGLSGCVDDYLDRWFSSDALREPTHPGIRYAKTRLAADDPAVIADYWRAMSSHQLLPHLGGIAIPVTVIAGSADKSAPVERLRDVARRIPAARFVVLDGPHMLQLEVPVAFQEAVAGHRQWVESAA